MTPETTTLSHAVNQKERSGIRSPFFSPVVQCKLTVNAPGDVYEREADAVADQVMRMPESAVQPVQRKCAACEKEEKEKLQRKEYGGNSNGVSPSVEREINAQRGRGKPLPAETRNFMEQRIGADFSQVKVHTDQHAVRLSRELNAQAFTHGRDVYFNTAKFAPDTIEGKRLLAHELTHVVQQVPSSKRSPAVQTEGSHLDRECTCQRREANESKGVQRSQTESIQRACGVSDIPNLSHCIGRGGDIADFGDSSDDIYLFIRNCDDFQPGEEARLRSLAASVGPDDRLEIDGFASEEGPEGFNENLSCARALKAGAVLSGSGVAADRMTFFQHGATPGYRDERRSVVVNLISPPAAPATAPAPATTTYAACFDGSNIYVNKDGRTHRCAAFTDTSDPTPNGEYCIREQGAAQLGWRPWRDHGSWFLLEPQFSTTRSRMHLHPGSRSTGCVTVTNETCFDELASILNGPGRITREGYDGYPPGNSEEVNNRREEKTCVGLLLVDRSGAGSCNAAMSQND